MSLLGEYRRRISRTEEERLREDGPTPEQFRRLSRAGQLQALFWHTSEEARQIVAEELIKVEGEG